MSTEWSFHYTGPKVPSKARGCLSCASAHSGMCMHQPPHTNIVEGCGLCLASQSGVCGAHGRGVAKALDEYVGSLDDDAADAFAAVRKAIDAELAGIPDTSQVQVTCSGHTGLDVDMGGERTGMPARHLSLLVSQIA